MCVAWSGIANWFPSMKGLGTLAHLINFSCQNVINGCYKWAVLLSTDGTYVNERGGVADIINTDFKKMFFCMFCLGYDTASPSYRRKLNSEHLLFFPFRWNVLGVIIICLISWFSG